MSVLISTRHAYLTYIISSHILGMNRVPAHLPDVERPRKGRKPLIPEDTIRNLISKSQEGDIEARNEFIEMYLGIIGSIAQKLSSNFHTLGMTIDDAMEEGVFGLIDAVRGFDLSRGTKFNSYATTKIRGAILDAIREGGYSNVRIPRLEYTVTKKWERAEALLIKELGRLPTDEEIRKKSKVDPETYKQAKLDMGRCFNTVYVDGLVKKNRDQEVGWESLKIEGQQRFPVTDEIETREIINLVLSKLGGRLVKTTFSISEVGEILGIGSDSAAKTFPQKDYVGEIRLRRYIMFELNGNRNQALESFERAVEGKEKKTVERYIFGRYYFGDLTMREIGNEINLSESRVCQLHSRALNRLRQVLEDRRIDPEDLGFFSREQENVLSFEDVEKIVGNKIRAKSVFRRYEPLGCVPVSALTEYAGKTSRDMDGINERLNRVLQERGIVDKATLSTSQISEITGLSHASIGDSFKGYKGRVPIKLVRKYISTKFDGDRADAFQKLQELLGEEEPATKPKRKHVVKTEDTGPILSRPREIQYGEVAQRSVPPQQDLEKFLYVRPKVEIPPGFGKPSEKQAGRVPISYVREACEGVVDFKQLRAYLVEAKISIDGHGVHQKGFERVVVGSFTPMNGQKVFQNLGYSKREIDDVYKRFDNFEAPIVDAQQVEGTDHIQDQPPIEQPLISPEEPTDQVYTEPDNVEIAQPPNSDEAYVLAFESESLFPVILQDLAYRKPETSTPLSEPTKPIDRVLQVTVQTVYKPKDRYVARFGSDERNFETPAELGVYVELLLRDGAAPHKIKTYRENGGIFRTQLVGWEIGK